MINLGRTLRPSKALSGALRRPSRLELLGCELVPAFKFLLLVLKLVQLPVDLPARQELLMSAHFSQLSLVHDQNLIGTLDGRKPVRNHKGCTSGHHTR